MSVRFVADFLLAKVITGEGGLDKMIRNIFVGAMTSHEILRAHLFDKEKKLIITSGDRSDMIMAALESDTAGIVLSNNILPPPTIISRAAERNVPLLMVNTDTYQVAKRMDDLEPLLTREDTEGREFLGQLVNKHVNLGWLGL